MYYLALGASDLGEVMNPAPHDICMVSKIKGIQMISPKDRAIRNDAIRIKVRYIAIGIKKIVEKSSPIAIESALPKTATGGAR